MYLSFHCFSALDVQNAENAEHCPQMNHELKSSKFRASDPIIGGTPASVVDLLDTSFESSFDMLVVCHGAKVVNWLKSQTLSRHTIAPQTKEASKYGSPAAWVSTKR